MRVTIRPSPLDRGEAKRAGMADGAQQQGALAAIDVYDADAVATTLAQPRQGRDKRAPTRVAGPRARPEAACWRTRRRPVRRDGLPSEGLVLPRLMPHGEAPLQSARRG